MQVLQKNGLIYFLKRICECDYRHEPLLAPTKEILDIYKKKEIDWPEYEKQFNDLLKMREAHTLLTESELHRSCLLCSEPTPDKCHRQLVAEYLKKHFDKHFDIIEINHL